MSWCSGRNTRYEKRGRQRGSILIIALWSLVLLSALAVAIYARVRPQLSLAGKLKERAQLYYLAKAGVRRALLEIENDPTDSCDALKDSWGNNEAIFKEVELGVGIFSIVSRLAGEAEDDVKYGLIDEERKINLNKASHSVLKSFFEVAGGTTSQEAEGIAASVIDWRDADDEHRENGAESGYYLTLAPGYPCKNQEFQVLEELLLVKGMTQELYDKVSGRMTIYGSGRVNINTADKLVLRSLGMGQTLAEKIIHFRKGNDGEEATVDDDVFESVSAIAVILDNAEDLGDEEISQLNGVLSRGFLSVCSNTFRGHAVGRMKNTDKSVQITFVCNRDKTIRYWRED